MEETSHLVHVALEKVERAFDDINADLEQYEAETPLPQITGRPSKQLAELIVSVNANDKITEQLKASRCLFLNRSFNCFNSGLTTKSKVPIRLGQWGHETIIILWVWSLKLGLAEFQFYTPRAQPQLYLS